ncbi:MAG: uncharacterized protein KVP18_001276 [Porospora cf. gigantea A]|uniref:uncharacterized protein n=1 Tax=Porospora cf. gigantea A TaxID=2853593 RepID=UPI0035595C1F|nr:MAG: hypothetical protein KVP18_001276 [Porospora cf. gigantea A]
MQREAILKQCVRLHADGCLLTDFAQTFESLRADKQGWLTAASLDREQMPQLLDLLTSLELLPYEMNFKARLDLQSSNRFELSLFTNGAAGHKKHSDNPALMHRGVRFAMMFFPNDPDWQDSDAGELVLWSKTTEVARIKPCGGDLVLLQSDKLQWSVTASRRDRFTISTWLTGPKAP